MVKWTRIWAQSGVWTGGNFQVGYDLEVGTTIRIGEVAVDLYDLTVCNPKGRVHFSSGEVTLYSLEYKVTVRAINKAREVLIYRPDYTLIAALAGEIYSPAEEAER